MYLLPGFVDMHTHIGGKAQGADYDYVFKLWMAHGVTTVREVGGPGLDWSVDLKKKSGDNSIIAPRIFTHTVFGQGSESTISTPEKAKEWVRENAKNGADGIKFFGANGTKLSTHIQAQIEAGFRGNLVRSRYETSFWRLFYIILSESLIRITFCQGAPDESVGRATAHP